MTPETLPPSRPCHGLDIVFPTNLPETDGEPLDSDWHRMAIDLLVEILRYHFRQRHDFFAGGNMFIYFSDEQVRNRDYRGPDVFFVWGVDGRKDRRYWAIWEEGGQYPNVIIELLSPTTAREDRTTKKALYEQKFRTPEYFMYDPDKQQLEGWHLTNGSYEAMEMDKAGRIWSRQLVLSLGTWDGPFQEAHRTWLRLFDVRGNLILIGREDQQQRADAEQQRADIENQRAEAERQRADGEKQRADGEKQQAEAERQRANAERQRADALEAELTRLRANLGKPKAGSE